MCIILCVVIHSRVWSDFAGGDTLPATCAVQTDAIYSRKAVAVTTHLKEASADLSGACV